MPSLQEMADHVTRMTSLTEQQAILAIKKLKIVQKGGMKELSELVSRFVALDREEASARLSGRNKVPFQKGDLTLK